MWKKVVGYTFLGIVAIAGSAFAYLYFRKPASRPAPDIRVAMTPDRIARGKYLYALGDCDGCHSPHDVTKQYLPVIESKRGSGQHIPEEGIPAKLYVPNITPDTETGIGKWTDGEKIRAIREGIGRDGRALFPMMPYTHFRHMSDDDVQSLVAYLNTLPPVHNQLPRTTVKFPVSMLIKGVPRPVEKPVQTPSRDNPFVYGEYLVTLGGCEACHTNRDEKTKKLAGGNKFRFGDFEVVSANITPDPDTGIGNWSREYFLDRFRQHRNRPAEILPAASKERFTIMPWRNLAQLSDDDLGAIYGYLMSRTPVVNKVNVHPVQVAQRH